MAEHVIDKFTYGGNTYILNGDFVGAKTAVDGEHGLVPTPAAGETTKILWSDGNWKTMTPRLTISGSNLQLDLLKQNDSGTSQMSTTTIALNNLNYNTFGKVSAGGVTAVADLVQDTLTITGTDGITVTADANTDTITIGGSGAGATYSDFTGATETTTGTHGLVPSPPADGMQYLLYGDGSFHGTWLEYATDGRYVKLVYNDGTEDICSGAAQLPLATTAADGFITHTDKTKLDLLSAGSVWYGTCNTVTATSAKEITVTSSYGTWPPATATYTLKTGSIINVFFNYPNSTSTPTINVNSTGAKPIRIGSAAPNGTDNQLMWDAGTLMSFIYDEAGDSGRGAYRYLTSVTYGTPYTQEISLVPIGTILDFAGSTAPTGYLICDGSAVSRTTYSDLFAIIGTTWGVGDGSTTFNLPNLCGRTTIGSGTGTATDATAHTLGDTNGTETHLLTANESGIHEHNHADTLTFKLPNHAHGLANSMIVYNNASSNTSRMATSGSGTKISVNTNVGLNTENPTSLSNCTKSGSVTKHSGADATTSHNNMQPYATVNKIIKAL